MRRLAGDDPEVNEEWITDKDRFAFAYGRGDDRLTRPLVRDSTSGRAAAGVLAGGHRRRGPRPAAACTAEPRRSERSWPQPRVGVLTGGRLTLEDAYAYAKFARAVLGTNNIDFRSRPHSRRGGRVPGPRRGRHRAAASTLRRPGAAPSSVLLVGFEPEEEAGAVFLRLRKAVRKKRPAGPGPLAPYLSNGARKTRRHADRRPCPGAEAAVLDALPTDVQLDAELASILVGERAGRPSGHADRRAPAGRATGARLAWVPRRAGDRGAVEAGCLPNLLPGGRPVADAAARVDTQATWGVRLLPALPAGTPTRCCSPPPTASSAR